MGLSIFFKRSFIKSIALFMIVLAFFNWSVVWGFTQNTAPGGIITGKVMAVFFVDVGQADCIFIHTPNNLNMLIDAGNREDYPQINRFLQTQNVTRLDVVVATHPHEDHIGSMEEIIRNFQIGKLYMPKVSTTTRTFEGLLQAIRIKGLKVNVAKAGVKIDLGPGFTSEFIAPNNDYYDDLNNYSGVIKLSYHKVALLLTGDAERISEREMLDKGYDLKADVLKVGHHGSSSSSSAAFLKRVAPSIAIISVGVDNPYHHPGLSTLKRLARSGARIYRTDRDGTIRLLTDGNKIEIHNYRY
jgi:competence protein ComEC